MEINAIVERHRCHTGVLNHGCHLVDIFDKIAVISSILQIAKAHAAAGVYIVRIFVCAHVEVLAVLACEVIDILLNQRLRECNSCVIRHVNGAFRAVVRASGTGQRVCRTQNGIHMTWGVDERNNRDALILSIRDNPVHLALRQLIGIEIVVCFIACVNRLRNCLTAVCLALCCHRHVIKQEAQSVIAHAQFQIVISICGSVVNDLLDTVNAEILSAGIKMDDLHEVRLPSARCVRRKARDRHGAQHAEHKDKR